MLQPFYAEGGVALFHGDCREVLASLPEETFSCCVTSPPFFGLRKYDCPPSLWGEWEGHYGGEPIVEMYVEHTVEVLREIRRVLRKDGVVWWDLDDSRAGSGRGFGGKDHGKLGPDANGFLQGPERSGVAPKNLLLIPQRVALAAQEDGWIVRSVCIIPTWMPESTKDRPTDAYRTVLMLTKSGTPSFWWNSKTLRLVGKSPPGTQGVEGEDWDWWEKPDGKKKRRSYWHGEDYWYDYYAVRQPMAASSKARIAQPTLMTQTGGEKQEAYEGSGNANRAAKMVQSLVDNEGMKNLGNVWNDIPPAGYPGAHFAAFHVNEPTRCILASCPEEICSGCGKPRVRVVQKKLTAHDGTTESQYEDGTTAKRLALLRQAARERGEEYVNEQETTGWTDCGCGAPFEPGLILDPFIGTGTTAEAARELGRYCVGIDASEAYLEQAKLRLTIGLAGIRKMVAAERKARTATVEPAVFS